jgi:WD40 repeat protein
MIRLSTLLIGLLTIAYSVSARVLFAHDVLILGDSKLRHDQAIYSMRFSSDGALCATGGFDGLKIWDTSTGALILHLQTKPEAIITRIAFRPDGKVLSFGNNYGHVYITDLTTKKAERIDGNFGESHALEFQPNGSLLAIGSRGDVALWNTETKKLHKNLMTFNTQCVAFAPDGKQLVARWFATEVRVWDVETGKQLENRYSRAKSEEFTAIAYSNDGKFLALGESASVTLVNLKDASEKVLPLPGRALIFHKESTLLLAMSPEKAVLWDLKNGGAVKELSLGKEGESMVAFAADPNLKLLGTGTFNGVIRLWDVATGKDLFPPTGHTARVNTVAITPDEKVAITGSADKSIKIWDLTMGKMVRSITFPNEVMTVLLGADGQLLLIDIRDSIEVVDTITWKSVATIPKQRLATSTVAISPDGKTIVSYKGSGVIELWDRTSGKAQSIKASSQNTKVNQLIFSPSGKRIISANANGTAYVITLKE